MEIIKSWSQFNESIGDVKITDYDIYNYNMELSLDDKLFFLDKVDFDVIVDFGCANGVLLEKIAKYRPNVKIIGYDLDYAMLQICTKANIPSDALLTDDWNKVIEEVSKYKRPLLNLSSVIHEVYSYNTGSINEFWEKNVFGSNFKYIVIRDMMPSNSIDSIDMSKYRSDIYRVRELSDPDTLNSFESHWGKIDSDYRTFMHYILKYRYKINWSRELLENYLPISIEDVVKKIPYSYKIIQNDQFIVPFIKEQTYKDYHIKMDQNTHTKLILEKK